MDVVFFNDPRLLFIISIRLCDDVLSSGVVLVDLPGYNNMNAAYSQITEAYRKRCDAFLVVGHIARVVSNSSFHEYFNPVRSSYETCPDKDCAAFENMMLVCTHAEDIHLR